MSTHSATKYISVRRNRDYSTHFKWTGELNAAVLNFYTKARNENSKGYMSVLKQLWDSSYPNFTNVNKRTLRERAAFLLKKRSNVALSEQRTNHNSVQPNPVSAAEDSETLAAIVMPIICSTEPISETIVAQQTLLSTEHPKTTSAIISAPESIAAISLGNHSLLADLRERFKKFIELFKNQPLNKRIYHTKFARTLPKEHICALNTILEEYIGDEQLSLWDLNCATYAGALAILERMNCLKERDRIAQPRDTKRPWVTQRETRINTLRRKISHLTVAVECLIKGPSSSTHRQQKIIAQAKKNYGSLNPERLRAKLGQLKHELRAEITRLQDDITRADRSRINYLFHSNPKLIYRKWRGEQFTVNNPPNEEEIHTFWAGIWSTPTTPNLETPWHKQLSDSYCKNATSKHYAITSVIMSEMLKKMPNNRSPGYDLITGYWIKSFTSLHKPLQAQLSNLKDGTVDMPDWLATGRTTLIPKNSDTHATNNYRPIACQNTTYKLYTSILNHFIEDHCAVNNILYPEQAGGKKGSWGCTDQLLINKMIMEEIKIHQRNAFFMWFDYKKAFDSVPHAWIRRALELAKLPSDITTAISNLMKSWKTRVCLNTPMETIQTGCINYENGVLQGDCLAMMLFILSINPLSHLLQAVDGYAAGPPGARETKITHLLFVDDLKTFDSGLTQAEEKLRVITEFTRDIGMQFGQEKCAYLNIEKGKRKQIGLTIEINNLKLRELDDNDTYRYLGLDEDLSYTGPLNKNRVTHEYYLRLKKIWRSNLNAANKVRAHNCFAMPLLTPTFGLLDWTKSEVHEIDIKTRKLLTMLGAFHRNSDVDRLYVSRRDGGRGLCSVLDTFYSRIISLSQHISGSSKHNVFMARVSMHEQEGLVEIARNLCSSLEIPIPESGETSQSTANTVKSKLKKKHASAWEQKAVHGYLNRKTNTSVTDLASSNSWTKSHKMTSHVEGYLCAIQEQEIATRQLIQRRLGATDPTAAVCRHCSNQPEDIAHIVGSCPKLAPTMYLPLRHNEVAKSLYHAVARTFDPLATYKNPERTSAIGPLEVWWDVRIKTAPKVPNNKPDMVIWNHDLKECTIVEVGVPLDVNVPRTESEKAEKYTPLMLGLQRLYPKFKIQVVPIVIGATGHITKNLKRHLVQLGFKEREVNPVISKLQERAIMGTVKIVKSALAKVPNSTVK